MDGLEIIIKRLYNLSIKLKDCQENERLCYIIELFGMLDMINDITVNCVLRDLKEILELQYENINSIEQDLARLAKMEIGSNFDDLKFILANVIEIKDKIVLYYEIEDFKERSIDLMMATTILKKIPETLTPFVAVNIFDNFELKENDQEVFMEIEGISKVNLKEVKLRNKQIVKRLDERRKQ